MTVPNESESAIADLLPVMGQLLRRLRAVSNTRELTWSQVAIMARLEEGGPTTTADLARAEAVKPQSMGVTLAVMEAEGLIERYAHPDDGRQMLVALTDDGRETRRKVRLAKHDWLMSAVANFTPAERKTLVSAVELIRRLGNS
ncbi:MarR family transcriptional regulator [Pandoraea pneumonica]|jgi:DNA-binding MarR family transcriptional regulator|uniref:MarR family transcriptional regulator n=1 Tax=Pandoraea pneumonica TaxID=2508299 RepID=A0A5E4WTG8_9BURK|nr:MarR family transcriptional regulator [Pandoraea pneumonica]VVE26884.1 MarR family transcriptional regulator [Pandoraea pneumonica]